jgi:enoyl-CoA hydratase/carnithine racemase
MLTGEHLDAQSEKDFGLVWKVIPDEVFEQELILSAQKLSKMPQKSQRDLKKIVTAGLHEEIEKAFELEAEAAERGALDQESFELISANRSKKNQP